MSRRFKLENVVLAVSYSLIGLAAGALILLRALDRRDVLRPVARP